MTDTDTRPLTWRSIRGFPNYAVSTEGDVMSWPRPHGKGGALRWSLNTSGYRTVTLVANGKSYTKRVHRLVAEAFLEVCPGRPVVNHKNGDKQANRVDNLEWCTAYENERHATLTGLKAKGDRHGSVKLQDVEVCEIRRLSKAEIPRTTIARRFGVSLSHIGRIIRREGWSHV